MIRLTIWWLERCVPCPVAEAAGPATWCPSARRRWKETDLTIPAHAGFRLGVSTPLPMIYQYPTMGAMWRSPWQRAYACFWIRRGHCTRIRRLRVVRRVDGFWIYGVFGRNATADAAIAGCVMAPGASVELVSCLGAKGCRGHFFLADFARFFLSPAWWIVRAPKVWSAFSRRALFLAQRLAAGDGESRGPRAGLRVPGVGKRVLSEVRSRVKAGPTPGSESWNAPT